MRARSIPLLVIATSSRYKGHLLLQCAEADSSSPEDFLLAHDIPLRSVLIPHSKALRNPASLSFQLVHPRRRTYRTRCHPFGEPSKSETLCCERYASDPLRSVDLRWRLLPQHRRSYRRICFDEFRLPRE